MIVHPRIRPTALRVPPSRRNHAIAAHELIRPHEVQHLANQIRDAYYLTDLTFAEQVADFLRTGFDKQFFRYSSDPRNADVWRSPLTTLNARRGDCEDWAIVVVSLLVASGTPCHLVVGHGHAWVEGEDEYGWFLIEPTNGSLSRNFRPTEYAPTQFIAPRYH